jgi:hypothetical protein
MEVLEPHSHDIMTLKQPVSLTRILTLTPRLSSPHILMTSATSALSLEAYVSHTRPNINFRSLVSPHSHDVTTMKQPMSLTRVLTLTSGFLSPHILMTSATSALSLETYVPYTRPNINSSSLISLLQRTFHKGIKEG